LREGKKFLEGSQRGRANAPKKKTICRWGTRGFFGEKHMPGKGEGDGWGRESNAQRRVERLNRPLGGGGDKDTTHSNRWWGLAGGEGRKNYT